MKSGYLASVAYVASMFLCLSIPASAQANPTDALLARGYHQWSTGHRELARRSYELAVKADPRSVEAHLRLAGLYLTGKDYSASTKQYQCAISLDPKNAKAWIGLGISYLHSGDKDLTRAAWQEAIRVEPARKAQLAPLLARLDAASP
ncbi:MAG: tetratricopeptide repeat protein [Thiobacillaceae bacterium]